MLLVGVAVVLAAAAVWRSGALARPSGVPLAVGLAAFVPQLFAPPPVRVTHGALIAIGAAWLGVAAVADQLPGRRASVADGSTCGPRTALLGSSNWRGAQSPATHVASVDDPAIRGFDRRVVQPDLVQALPHAGVVPVRPRGWAPASTVTVSSPWPASAPRQDVRDLVVGCAGAGSTPYPGKVRATALDRSRETIPRCARSGVCDPRMSASTFFGFGEHTVSRWPPTQ